MRKPVIGKFGTQWLRVSFMAIFAMGTLSGCLGMDKNSNAVQVAAQAQFAAGGNNAVSMQAFSATLYPFLRSNCASCHGGSQNPLFAVSSMSAAFGQAIQNVNFASVSLSKIVVEAGNGHCGLPSCTGNSSAAATLVSNWNALTIANGGSNTSVAIPIGNVFTAPITVPSPNAAACPLPDNGSLNGPSCSYSNLNSTQGSFNNANPPVFTPDSCTNSCWTKLRYPVTKMSPAPTGASIQRAWFEVDFIYDNYTTPNGAASYSFKNPRVVSPDGPVYVHNVRTFINGAYYPNYGEDYQNADLVVNQWNYSSQVAYNSQGVKDSTVCSMIPAAPTAFDPNILNNPDGQGNVCIPSVPVLRSTDDSASGILQVNPPDANGNPTDTLAFSFDYFQSGIVSNCTEQAMWYANVYAPIKNGALACLNCHKAGGAVSQAGQLFNMDDGSVTGDTINGPNPAAAQVTICQKFLQRTSLGNPQQSSIIVQPEDGLNGMPAQANFDYYKPSWIAWISAEAANIKH